MLINSEHSYMPRNVVVRVWSVESSSTEATDVFDCCFVLLKKRAAF